MPKRSFSEFKDKNKVNAWSEKNELKAHEVSLYSHKKAIFNCYNEDCGHEFESRIGQVAGGSWCPFCSKNRRLCKEKSCIPCRKNSFASFHDKDKVNAWSSKNKLKPYEVTIYSHEIAIFKCYNEKCGRDFELKIYQVSKDKNWCKCCTGVTLCKKKECIPCFNKSFASFKCKDRVNALSEKNGFKAHEVTISSTQKAIFKCHKCTHEFKTRIADISNGTWCPFCNASKNRFTKKLFELFDKMNIEYNIEIPVKCEDRNLKWDMIVYKNEREFYIESDGEHHFSVKGILNVTRGTISNEEAEIQFKNQRERDLLKEKYIVDNNKLLFRISYNQLKQ